MSDELVQSESPEEDDLQEVEKYLQSINPRIFEGVNKKKKEELLKSFSFTLIQSKSHSGPLPAPETLQEYNEMIPNGAERIMKMAENQQLHRHELEKTVIPGQVNQSRNGQWFGFILGLIGLGCGTFLAYSGQPYVGGIIAGTTVVSLVSVFVIGKRAQRKDIRGED